MKKRIVIILISIILAILDNAFSPFFAIRGVYPSLLFIFSISYSIISGKEEGVFIGVLSGFLQDIYFFNGFGVNMLINMLVCFIAGYIGEGILKEKRMIPSVIVLVATIVKYLIVFIIMYICNVKIGFFKGILIGIYNFILMLITYKFIFKRLYVEKDEGRWSI